MAKNNNNGPVYAMAAVICVLILTVGLVYSGSLRTGGASTTVPQGSSLSSISVSASGTAVGTPSRAQINMYINGTGNSSSAATANLSAELASFNKTVYSFVGGNLSLVQTGYYNVGKVYSNNSTAAPVYQAQEYLTVTLPQISKLNSFLSSITNVSSVQISGVSAMLSNAQTAQLKSQALQSALANATSQATSVIGNVAIVNTTISVGSYYAVPFPMYATGSNSAGGGPAQKVGSLYYNGTTSVYESITATFYYKK